MKVHTEPSTSTIIDSSLVDRLRDSWAANRVTATKPAKIEPGANRLKIQDYSPRNRKCAAISG